MRKQIHSQQRDQIRQRPREFGPELKEPEDQHRNQCCPNLNLNGIGAGAYKCLDLQILLQRLKEELDSPAVLVNARNRCRPQGHVIRQKDQDLVVLRIIDLDPSKRMRTFLNGLGPCDR
jgi:hypothetical protein